MPRILIAEDEPAISFGLELDLKTEGYDVEVVADGETAAQRGSSDAFDLIVLDLMLPKKDGFQVCAELKKDHTAKEIPIVAVFSGKGEQLDADRCKQLGAASYVSKGQGAAPLVAEIKTLLANSGLTEPRNG